MQGHDVESSGLPLFADPVRVVLSHAPLTLLAMVPICDALSFGMRDVALWNLSSWCLLSGLLWALPMACIALWQLTRLSPDHDAAPLAANHCTLLLGALAELIGSLLLRAGSVFELWSPLSRMTALVGVALLILAALHAGALEAALRFGCPARCDDDDA
jgi:uncharacterized membrane protein